MTKLWSLDEIAEFTSYRMGMARKLVAQPDFPFDPALHQDYSMWDTERSYIHDNRKR